ncbi:MAG TPA: acyl-CoA-binding protein [Terriglobales bacterium]|nr:acyl-CoA-binding protein [Terriglobales bacterium]
MSIAQEFARAQKEVNELPTRPNNDMLLKLYAYYKQATEGDASGERPEGFDFVRRAKFDAWSEIKGTPKDEAMKKYVALVASLKN